MIRGKACGGAGGIIWRSVRGADQEKFWCPNDEVPESKVAGWPIYRRLRKYTKVTE